MINILLCIDDFKGDYTRHCAVTILSLLETNKNHKIKFYIMSSCLPQENIDELKRIVKLYNQEIVFIIQDNIIPEDIKNTVINRRNLTWGTWYRLFFPSYIKNIDRLLYIDCDILVTKDIGEIYNMDMKGKAIAGFDDLPMHKYIKKQHFGIDNYINAGVLLIDTKKYDFHKINKNNIEKINKKYGEHINDSDQDYLNLIFKDDIIIYNKTMNYQITNKFFNKGLNDAVIIHCLSKPYVQYSNCPQWIINLYYKYLELTKWKGYKIDKVNYGYIKHISQIICNFCYHGTLRLIGEKQCGYIFTVLGKYLYKI